MQNEGTIYSLNEKGFGFITVEGKKQKLFFHVNEVKDTRFDELQEGDTVAFSGVGKSDKGEFARGVTLVQ